MNQIMRLRRAAGDYEIDDRNNGSRHGRAFTSLIRDNGILWEAELLPRSYGGDSFFGKFAPAAGLELVDSLPVITRALLRRKVTPAGALKPHRIPKEDLGQVREIYDKIESRPERFELNLYIVGDEQESVTVESEGSSA
jgi:succinate dehydrogenase / fumarate reductase iron-sulfur subunit